MRWHRHTLGETGGHKVRAERRWAQGWVKACASPPSPPFLRSLCTPGQTVVRGDVQRLYLGQGTSASESESLYLGQGADGIRWSSVKNVLQHGHAAGTERGPRSDLRLSGPPLTPWRIACF
ncbi:hypothetical protein AAFF_G00168880 [Aldrovandia affinis]|uniref:Uncharacterized protein n=1 Tax=Aldrovandia affinis TaxID=143900 RepID=A0AAD7W7E1_9TELE|nr:hypothetical protein AAFF_G00168880 [Aldrovandia affinis]